MLLSLPCLHNSNNDCINNISSFNVNIRVNASSWTFVFSLCRLAVTLSWHIVNLEVRILEAKEHAYFFLRREFRLLLVLFV